MCVSHLTLESMSTLSCSLTHSLLISLYPRNCKTGEATFFLYSPQSRLIHAKIHAAAQRLNFNKERRRASAVSTQFSMECIACLIQWCKILNYAENL